MRKQNIQFQHHKQNFMSQKVSVQKETQQVNNIQKYNKKVKARKINQQNMKALLSNCLLQPDDKNRRYNAPIIKQTHQPPVYRSQKITPEVEKSIVH